jgi:hypothetical protein
MDRGRTFIAAMLAILLAACGAIPPQETAPEVSDRPPAAATKEPAHAIARDIPPNGVVISEGPDGRVGMDMSGHGAVLCVWRIYLAVAVYWDTCFPDEDREARQELAKGIEAINAFILANSVPPVSKADLDARIARDREQLLALPKEKIDHACLARPEDGDAGTLAAMRSRMRSIPPEEFRAGIADLLSVPRPPVMNPCL